MIKCYHKINFFSILFIQLIMKYIIHRGITSKDIKENSYTAIKKAIKDKESIGVEFDIRLTKDHKIVLSHNSLINLNVIEETNYSDLIKNNYLTTLDKILDIDTNKIFLIDIKTNNNYKVFGDILMNTINKYNKNIYLASFDKNIIKYIKSKYKKGIITLLYRRNNYNFIITNYKLISNNKIKKIKDKEIFLWTIHNNNELEEIKNKFSNIGDYYIIKDKKE